MASILIIDDEPQISGLLSGLLVRAGHNVRTAPSPQVAIEMCSPPACFDLVLSEVNMPAMDGHELARWIADRCPSSRTILLSASGLACEECPYAPHCSLIRKPFEPKAVLATVASALAAPAPRKCVMAQLLSTTYSTALNAFYDFPGSMPEELHSGDSGYESARKQKEAAYIALLAARADFRAHLSEHGCHQPPMAAAAYQRIENRLRRELLEARAVFDSAADKLRRLTPLLSELEISPEESPVLEQAKRVHHVAHQVYLMTLQRLSDFLGDEIFQAEKRRKPL